MEDPARDPLGVRKSVKTPLRGVSWDQSATKLCLASFDQGSSSVRQASSFQYTLHLDPFCKSRKCRGQPHDCTVDADTPFCCTQSRDGGNEWQGRALMWRIAIRRPSRPVHRPTADSVKTALRDCSWSGLQPRAGQREAEAKKQADLSLITAQRLWTAAPLEVTAWSTQGPPARIRSSCHLRICSQQKLPRLERPADGKARSTSRQRCSWNALHTALLS